MTIRRLKVPDFRADPVGDLNDFEPFTKSATAAGGNGNHSKIAIKQRGAIAPRWSSRGTGNSA
ncbi:hypothetical protein IQ266_07745 [filamentous cyanobacterium LEGE 11480]|uniref:Uncharacterized protein n=1 Tax=Romeriopsis navalis LEGE 11480 TaxID=2777977 RepID=A0A928VN93_9CYAN|nr:hypothetical protein [Romeriopsis navalis]MBE9029620.1 hypothetical protein [Romeriopsis navalis LEGE 11480]